MITFSITVVIPFILFLFLVKNRTETSTYAYNKRLKRMGAAVIFLVLGIQFGFLFGNKQESVIMASFFIPYIFVCVWTIILHKIALRNAKIEMKKQTHLKRLKGMGVEMKAS